MDKMKPPKGTPTKEQVRTFLKNRLAEHLPPPSIIEIRRQLGWDLVRKIEENNRRR